MRLFQSQARRGELRRAGIAAIERAGRGETREREVGRERRPIRRAGRERERRERRRRRRRRSSA
jgi:hypothetical protein